MILPHTIPKIMMNPKILQLVILQCIFFLSCLSLLGFCLQTDTISPNIILKDPDTIVSRGNVYKLGFFTPANTRNRYLGISYAVSETTLVWVANRDKPLKDSSSTVTISKDGNLVLINGRNETVWSTNATTESINTTVRLQDSGNLVLSDNKTGTILWESFKHPTDAFLPNMKLFDNIKTGEKVMASSWKNKTDPEVGIFTTGFQALNIPQTFTWKNNLPYWRSGPWNGNIFIGVQGAYDDKMNLYTVGRSPPDSIYVTSNDLGDMLIRFNLNSSGSLIQSLWNDQKKDWDVLWLSPQNECDVYGTCGPFGHCDPKSWPICSCLRGFEPVNGDEWGSRNWTSGCRRRKQLECNEDKFLEMEFMKVPDFAEQFPGKQEDECRIRCLRNCSCIAYAFDDTIGCMFWRENLIDIQKFAGVGYSLYLRLPASELTDIDKSNKLVIIIPVVGAILCISVLIFIARCWMVKRKGGKTKDNRRIFEAGQRFSLDSTEIVLKDESQVNIKDLPIFTAETLANATNKFHNDNLLGRGGFGPVYKGKLTNGKEIAVKRLSADSGQGMDEFMNEVIVISKLQHRNLVKLLGCCVDKEEKMLVYEYMPNKSLDVGLFDWAKRFSIMEGIGRGLLYLHRDSRLRIIHRDLKPSNVLLDEEWNPKISDFGMARIFGNNQDHADTARVVGTYGYMAPEYALEGRFSEKSDVYSFGVLMLEIVKGQKNSHYYNDELSLSLLGFAWKMWSEGNALGFCDESSIGSSDFAEEIRRCIQIALLCVQEYPEHRPSVQTVLSMLSREIMELPLPKEPVFAEKWNDFSVGPTQPVSSTNELTLSMIQGR